jgi:hypothetical protein
MIKAWRREFSSRGATSSDFPFGVVNLHGWCGEEEGSCNPGYPNSYGPGKNTASRVATQFVAWMRWSQLGSMPTAPNPTLGANTFTAMTYDLPDPQFGYTTSPYGNCTSVGKQPGECFAPRPRSNGPIHPRNKLEVGRRIALAALALSDSTSPAFPHSGPVFEGCTVTAASGIEGGVGQGGRSTTIDIVVTFALVGSSVLFVKNSDGFEVQLADQSWIAAPIVSTAGATLTLRATATLVPIALRLHWRDNPCCPKYYGDDPAFNQWYGVAIHPNPDAGVCPPKNCSLYSAVGGKPSETELPAVPFMVSIDPMAGRCMQFPTAKALVA